MKLENVKLNLETELVLNVGDPIGKTNAPRCYNKLFERLGMNAIMVLAMVPGIQCGISLNLGLPIGLVAGLIGGLMTIEFGIPGWGGFLFAIAVGAAIAAVAGWLYGLLLNRLKGEEMSVTTYVGFSIVSVMCIAWLVLPFTSLKLRWPLGTGLRNTIGLDSSNFKHILDDLLSFSIGDFTVPTGLILFMLLCCFLVWLFSRSKTGVAMQAVGNNPRFAEATGINVDRMRIVGTMLSTVLGAVGILVYSQSYGFMQLYTAPRQMGFIAASAILIGGASTSRCKISHVIIGTFLFQGVLTNTGFIGFAVLDSIFGSASVFLGSIFIAVSNVFLYSIGVGLLRSGGADGERKRGFSRARLADMLRDMVNAPLVASLVAMVLFFTGAALPGPLAQGVSMTGNVTSPLAMMLVGLSLADADLRQVLGQGCLWGFTLIRFLVVPLLAYVALAPLVPSALALGVFTVLLAMPTGSMAGPIAATYGQDGELPARGTIVATLASFAMVPVIMVVMSMA